MRRMSNISRKRGIVAAARFITEEHGELTILLLPKWLYFLFPKLRYRRSNRFSRLWVIHVIIKVSIALAYR